MVDAKGTLIGLVGKFTVYSNSNFQTKGSLYGSKCMGP